MGRRDRQSVKQNGRSQFRVGYQRENTNKNINLFDPIYEVRLVLINSPTVEEHCQIDGIGLHCTLVCDTFHKEGIFNKLLGK